MLVHCGREDGVAPQKDSRRQLNQISKVLLPNWVSARIGLIGTHCQIGLLGLILAKALVCKQVSRLLSPHGKNSTSLTPHQARMDVLC